MDWILLSTAVATLAGLGLIIAALLAFASVKFAVRVDEKEAAIRAALPGANCGACGFPGCDGYAAAVAAGKAPPNACTVGGTAVASRIGEIVGLSLEVAQPKVAVLVCRGNREVAPQRFLYEGAYNCRQAAILHGGPKACIYGCVGMGHCVSVCPFSAITMGADGLPDIDEKKCTGCGKCVAECPKHTLMLLPRSKFVYLACTSHDRGKAVKDVCKVGCIACGLCVKACPVGALKLTDNLPIMDLAKCIDCGICVHKCPTKSFIDRAPGRPKATINPKCTGCQECIKVCQFKAIEGEPTKQHRVVAEKCIGCGECRRVCKYAAIDMVGALGHSVRAT